MEIKNIDSFEGIDAAYKPALTALMKSVELASSMLGSAPSFAPLEFRRIALSAAVHTVNTMLAASSAKCNLASPPEDIDMIADSDGTLVYRCRHATPHKWKLSGDRA